MSDRWDDNQPIYWQLRERTVAAILDGTLAEGEPLPSVRQVAVDFHINPLTVSKAYQSLVDDALVEKRRGVGMFVVEGARERLLELGPIPAAERVLAAGPVDRFDDRRIPDLLGDGPRLALRARAPVPRHA